MKNLFTSIILGLVASSLPVSAFTLSVGNPVYDPFTYTPSGATSDYLSGQANAQGLTWVDVGNGSVHKPWLQTATGGVGNISGLASEPASADYVVFGASTTSSGISAKLPIGGTITSGTVYYSMILTVSTVPNALSTTAPNGVVVAGFNNTTTSSTAQPSTIGAPLYIKSPTAGNYQIGISEGVSAPVVVSYDSTVRTPGSTPIFIVGSYTFSAAGSTADTGTLWINPPSSSFGAVDPSLIPTPTVGPFNNSTPISRATGIVSYHLREAVSYAPAVNGDALRIGLTWADVTPPNAVTPSFSGLGSNPSSDTYGTIVTLSGTLSGAGPLYPNQGETISVSINGHVETTTINDYTGDFSLNYDPGDHVPASATPYTVTYSYAGNGYLNAVSDTSTMLTMNKANQTITWVVNPLPDQTYGVAPFSLLGDATNNSGAQDSYSVASGPASITGTTITITGVGTVTVDANQTGTANYNAATPVPESFNVVNSFPPLPIASQTFNVATGLQVCWPTINGVVYNVLTNGSANSVTGWMEDTDVSPVTGDGNTDCVIIPTASLPSTNLFVLIKQNSN